MLLNHVTRLRRWMMCGAIGCSMLIPLGFPQAAPPPQHAAMNAANASRHAEEEGTIELGPASTSEKQGYGCIIAGGAALAITAVVGTTNVIGLFTGTTTLPVNAGITEVGLALAGTVVASTCAVGALVAPTALRLWRIYYEGAQVATTP
jgi:hypothetical protein